MELEIVRKEAGQSMSQWVYGVLRGNIIKLHLAPGLAMTEVEIEIALNEIPNLSESDKAEILKYLKTLSYEEQKKFLDNLLGNQ